MDFGLGLVLSFTDNASAGMNNAVQSLAGLTSVAEQASDSLDNLGNTASLMAVSSASSMLGNNLIRTGTGMLGLFTRLINKYTNETIYAMNIECNDIVFDICINEKDLIGEPQIGRRFKGKIWMQGSLCLE